MHEVIQVDSLPRSDAPHDCPVKDPRENILGECFPMTPEECPRKIYPVIPGKRSRVKNTRSGKIQYSHPFFRVKKYPRALHDMSFKRDDSSTIVNSINARKTPQRNWIMSLSRRNEACSYIWTVTGQMEISGNHSCKRWSLKTKTQTLVRYNLIGCMSGQRVLFFCTDSRQIFCGEDK